MDTFVPKGVRCKNLLTVGEGSVSNSIALVSFLAGTNCEGGEIFLVGVLDLTNVVVSSERTVETFIV